MILIQIATYLLTKQNDLTKTLLLMNMKEDSILMKKEEKEMKQLEKFYLRKSNVGGKEWIMNI